MPSPADVRARLEGGLRLLAIAALGWSLVRSLTGAADAPEAVRSATLRPALARWSTVSAPSAVGVELERPPAAFERDWLAALRAAGTTVHWRGDSLLPTAVAVVSLADPGGGIEAGIAAPRGRTAVLEDATGPLDSVAVREHGARFHLTGTRGPVEVRVGSVPAGAAPLDSLVLRRLLVVGKAGWEMKFVVAALGERGWTVDAHHVVSPRSDVVQGAVRPVASAPAAASPARMPDMTPGRTGTSSGIFQFAPLGAPHGVPPPIPAAPRPSGSPRGLSAIDTSQYAAVVAIDSSAGRYASLIVRYVRQGGGVILWPDAAKASGLAGLSAGRGFGEPVEGVEEWPADGSQRAALDLRPISGLRDDAVVLERRDEHAAIAARRIGAGRTLTLGYADTWRWRMVGNGDAPAEHRAWLAGLVAGVAYAPRAGIAAAATDPAPLASLVSDLGPQSLGSVARSGSVADPSLWWVFALICAAILVEWASRRLRGVR